MISLLKDSTEEAYRMDCTELLSAELKRGFDAKRGLVSKIKVKTNFNLQYRILCYCIISIFLAVFNFSCTNPEKNNFGDSKGIRFIGEKKCLLTNYFETKHVKKKYSGSSLKNGLLFKPYSILLSLAMIPILASGQTSCPSPSLVSLLFGGGSHNCAYLENKKIKCWGYNSFGQLGYGDKENRGDNSGEMGNDLPAVDLGVEFNNTLIQISPEALHTCALSEGDNVKCWGYNSFGQLGYGDTENRGDEPGEMGNNLTLVNLGDDFNNITRLSSGWYHNCVLSKEGEVKCWGRNSLGQLGYGDKENRGDEPGEMGNNLTVVDLGTGFNKSTVQLSLGSLHTCALSEGGNVKCWGYNDSGQLGYGDLFNNRGDDPGEMGNDLPAVDLGTGFNDNVIQITSGPYHNCVLSNEGNVKCWGRNNLGQLGYGDSNNRGDQSGEMGNDLPVVDLGIGFNNSVIQIAAEHSNTCSLSEGGNVKCWGSNSLGQLGYGDVESRGGDPGEMGNNLTSINLGDGFNNNVTHLAVGGFYFCALSGGGQVKCWGDNSQGQLGYGDVEKRGDEPGEMGNNLTVVDLGGTTCSPTSSPTSVPSNAPSYPPSNAPSYSPSQSPTSAPTSVPTFSPTFSPTQPPTSNPTGSPTFSPTFSPTQPPTNNPTGSPTISPTKTPTFSPTDPTVNPTNTPTFSPTYSPSGSPSQPPTLAPSYSPTFPTTNPTNAPTLSPSLSPTDAPTENDDLTAGKIVGISLGSLVGLILLILFILYMLSRIRKANTVPQSSVALYQLNSMQDQ